MNRIDNCFANLKENGQKAFIPFVTAGDPDLGTTVELVRAMTGAGADIIELGVPYSEPLADGPVIQKAVQRSLERGTTLAKILEAVTIIRKTEQVPLVLMSYYNPILQYGLDNFVQHAVEAGVDGVIVPDLPVEECPPLFSRALEKGLYLIQLVAPTTTEARLKKIARFSRGFIYCVSVTGVTGVREETNNQIANLTSRVRQVTSLPVGIGFGVSAPAQAAQIARHCDAVIAGSVLVKIIENNSDNAVSMVAGLVADFKSALSG
ncbi:tryptophan synthase alpha chain [Desulfohalotomaculum tongense]|uniref:tryptophan synthase subunit alpha n=1 Tax=Desulforadius tongensis TaxID=1216062 RepID=UPI00195C7C7B|nr:tryptophan synthase subunit alpha [Desulforadius tongensis]MBM7854650.1 tryptophan synthase alpha chain [Desulforadius tongensis]